jgi:biotin operon repressor
MPAEMISPYVPVSGPALGEELGVLETRAVAG